MVFNPRQVINFSTQHSTWAANIKLYHPTFNFTFEHSKLIIQLKLSTFDTTDMITHSWKTERTAFYENTQHVSCATNIQLFFRK